ncbi:MFS transporter [Burkholderia cepacia]|uniref:hypothetical protein n=1 Tax=Burkholderia cepacia TaxID=292 RepID=UPI00158AD0BF|nr:hypothetical protein [Burkholderia cepacia]MCA8055782.1 hypothetical protein [Burkholderia cepacia]MCA8132999.1 hypothetical protein [Burkholderia cepacia]MCA8160826.1 hypothetical protein [Burkholderia cepacia]HEM7894683.1 hypothetical protein [Burkholderia cepacia]HEM8511270.1 hypothetical protein [Burkholderia cepacia]
MGGFVNRGGRPGSVASGWLMDRFDRYRVIAASFCLAARSLRAVHGMQSTFRARQVLAFAWGSFIPGTNTGMNVLTALLSDRRSRRPGLPRIAIAGDAKPPADAAVATARRLAAPIRHDAGRMRPTVVGRARRIQRLQHARAPTVVIGQLGHPACKGRRDRRREQRGDRQPGKALHRLSPGHCALTAGTGVDAVAVACSPCAIA